MGFDPSRSRWKRSQPASLFFGLWDGCWGDQSYMVIVRCYELCIESKDVWVRDGQQQHAGGVNREPEKEAVPARRTGSFVNGRTREHNCSPHPLNTGFFLSFLVGCSLSERICTVTSAHRCAAIQGSDRTAAITRITRDKCGFHNLSATRMIDPFSPQRSGE